MLSPSSEPSPADIRAGLNAILRDSLRPAAIVLAICYFCITLAHPFILPEASRTIMTAMAGGSFLVALGMVGLLLRWHIPPSRANHWAGAMCLLVIINMTIHMLLTPLPMLTANILLMMLASSCFLLSHWWLGATLVWGISLWSVGVGLNPDADWGATSHLVVVSVPISLLVYGIRYRTFSQYEKLRLEDARLKAELQKTTDRLQDRLQLEHVLTQISARLLKLSVAEIDSAIDEAMQVVGECFEVDHVCFCRVNSEPSTLSITHEWRAPGSQPRKPWIQETPTSSMPWVWEHLEKDQNLQIDSVSEMPPTAEVDKENFESLNIRSCFAVPLAMQGGTRGILAMCNETKDMAWSNDTASLLRVLGEIFVAAIQRKEDAEEISNLNQRLQQASRLVALGEMAASLAHDLTNGLSAISLQTKGALRKADRGSLKLENCEEYIRDISHQSERLTVLLTTIQKFARSRPKEFVPMHLADVLKDVDTLLGSKLRHSSVTVQCDDPSSWPPLLGDPAQITLVTVNLILNAAQAMADIDPDKRQILVSAHTADPEFVEISIRDSGAGVPPELREKIFEKFYTTKKEGLGLGLAFSRSYIEQHGGKMWCNSEPGNGGDFRFTLPLPKP